MYGEVHGGVGGGMRSKSPKVQGLQGPGVPRSHSNTSLTLKKVHLVLLLLINFTFYKELLCFSLYDTASDR